LTDYAAVSAGLSVTIAEIGGHDAPKRAVT
jgi:hypothetical protein